MIEILKTEDGILRRLDKPERNCWVNVYAIDDEDAKWLMSDLGVIETFISSMRDWEEVSRADKDDASQQTLVVVDYPVGENPSNQANPDVRQFDTQPVAILILEDQEIVVTSTVGSCSVIERMKESGASAVDTAKRTNFMLNVLLRIAEDYIDVLRTLEKETIRLERKMRKVQKNTGLISMLGIEKSLLYISTSLKSCSSTFEVMKDGRFVHLYHEDKELFDELLVEYKQASEMCSIYTDVITKAMDAFSSVVNNNVNASMGVLTTITLLLSIPTVIFSFYGMNTHLLPFADSWVFPTLLSLGLAAIAVVFLMRFRN